MIIATVVEVLSGERYDQYCIKHIFSVLEMNRSRFCIMDFSVEEAHTNFAAIYRYLYPEPNKPGYYIANCGLDDRATYEANLANPIHYEDYVIGTNGGLFSPQGGMRTSLSDLINLMLVHINRGSITGSDGTVHTILTPESIDEMHTVQWSGYSDGEYKMYGLYQEITDRLTPDSSKLVGHTSGAYGLCGALFVSMERKYGIVVVSSGTDSTYTNGYCSAVWDVFQYLYSSYIS